MSNGKRFATLFKGHEERYGRYELAGRKNAKGKEEGQAKTIDSPITEKDYASHVSGKYGIGVIPLQGEPGKDGIVNFAAIDIDVYKEEEQTKKKLTPEEVARATGGTPLIVTRSKSGGIHVWLFSKRGVLARNAVEYLKYQAANLGVAGTEIFPKQTERHSLGDIGNWINLPYFGDTRKAVIPREVDKITTYYEPDLERFLDIAEMSAEVVTDDWLIDNTDPVGSRVSTDDKKEELFLDGPPCLQRLIAGMPHERPKIERDYKEGKITEDVYHKRMNATNPQLDEGARDTTFLNVAIYLRNRMFPTERDAKLEQAEVTELIKALNAVHSKWVAEKGDNGETANAIPRLAKQAASGKYGYHCTHEPLKSFCRASLCSKRDFGITDHRNDNHGIEGLTVVKSSERQYYMTVNGKRIYIPDAKTLNHQGLFATAVLNQTDRMWTVMQDARYRAMMDGLLNNAGEIEPPPDSDEIAIGLNALHEFVHDKKIAKGQNDAAVHNGRVIWSKDELTATFILSQYVSFLRSRSVLWSAQKASRHLIDDYGVIARGNTHIGNKQCTPYEVSIAHLDKLKAGKGES